MNLFDVTRGFQGNKGDKPRTATHDEIFAYAHWLRTSRGLPNFPGATLRWRSHARGADPVCVAVTFGGDKETGAYSLLLPGYASHRDRVTFETVDDSGEVETSQTLPVEPKKGGVIWDKAAVHKACGPVAKPAKGKRAKVADPIPVAAPEPVTIADELPAPETVKESLTVAVDLDAITARLDALEQALATLSAVSAASGSAASTEGANAEATPTARAKRTPAHERAIRRAWAERAAFRKQRALASEVKAELKAAWERQEEIASERDRARADAKAWEASSNDMWRAVDRTMGKRIATAQRARRMIAAARAQIDLKTRALEITNATVARLKSSAVPASEIARLEQERDTAQTALAAMVARAERAEQGIETMGERFSSLVGRLSKAEAALQGRAA